MMTWLFSPDFCFWCWRHYLISSSFFVFSPTNAKKKETTTTTTKVLAKKTPPSSFVVKAYRMMLFSSSFDDDDDTRAYIIKRILLRSFSSQKSDTFSLFVALLRSKIFLRGFVQAYLGFEQTLNRIALFPSSSFGKTAACSTHSLITTIERVVVTRWRRRRRRRRA